MTTRIPPRAATWLLRRLGPGYHAEALAGDLFEEYQRDRAPSWYWGQTATAIGIGMAHGLRRRLARTLLAWILRVLIEFGVIFGGIALAESKVLCPAPLPACHYSRVEGSSGAAATPAEPVMMPARNHTNE